jgi:hypothetical protein
VQIVQSPVRKAALKGLILYAIVATIDGATNLIPVMAFYWFAYMVFLFGLPGESQKVMLDKTVPQAKPSIRNGESLVVADLIHATG